LVFFTDDFLFRGIISHIYDFTMRGNLALRGWNNSRKKVSGNSQTRQKPQKGSFKKPGINFCGYSHSHGWVSEILLPHISQDSRPFSLLSASPGRNVHSVTEVGGGECRLQSFLILGPCFCSPWQSCCRNFLQVGHCSLLNL
jgi:hypothetical protein